jgi:endonuclease YncB( thermonuclease family)
LIPRPFIRTAASLFLAAFLPLSSAANWTITSGQVVGVIDGDTVTVLTSDRTQQRIRLSGIDAPEKRQPFGQRAKQRLSDLAFGRHIAVEWSKKDRYGRVVGKLVHGGRDLNLAMIESGYAWWYERYARDQLPEDRALYREAQDRARKSKAGLWRDVEPVAPWDFRRVKVK